MEMKQIEEELFIGPVIRKYKRPVYNIKQSIEFFRNRDELLYKHKQLIELLASLTDQSAIDQVNKEIIKLENEIYLVNQSMSKYIAVDSLRKVVGECMKYYKVSIREVSMKADVPYFQINDILSKGFNGPYGFKLGVWAIKEFSLDANKYLKDL